MKIKYILFFRYPDARFNRLDYIKILKEPPKIIFTILNLQFEIKAFEYDFIIYYSLKPIALIRF
jgi:hypothetical protein